MQAEINLGVLIDSIIVIFGPRIRVRANPCNIMTLANGVANMLDRRLQLPVAACEYLTVDPVERQYNARCLPAMG